MSKAAIGGVPTSTVFVAEPELQSSSFSLSCVSNMTTIHAFLCMNYIDRGNVCT